MGASVMLTASFDGLAKVHQAATLETLWTYRLDGPATCAAWRPDGMQALAVGLDGGNWHVRERQVPKVEDKDAPAKPKSKARTEGYLRGLDAVPGLDDEVIAEGRPAKRREKQIDFMFRKFEY